MLRRRRRAGECLLEERDPRLLARRRPAQRRRSPGPALHHLGEQAELDGAHHPLVRQAVDGLVHERQLLLRELNPRGRQGAECTAERGQDLPRVPRVEPVDTRAVLAVRKVHVQLAQERRDRHPEIIPHDDDRLDSRAVALPERLDQFRSLRCRVRVQPLLELIENEQELVAGGKRLAPADLGE